MTVVKASLRPQHEQRVRIGLESPIRDPRLTFEVRSDSPVTTYLVDDMGLEDYANCQTPNYYAGFKERCNHQAELTFPSFSRYHLIIVNKSPDQSAKIEYDIKAR